MSSIRLLLLFCCLILLTACGQPSLKTSFIDYQQQIADELNISLQVNSDSATLGYPSSEELKVKVPETTMKLRDFYGLKHCSVSLLIAQRNTALGKMQLPSKRFAYEVKLIHGLQQCFQQTENEDQQQQLHQWITEKQQSLPMVWAQMILNSSEIRRSLSGNTALFSQIPQTQLQTYQDSLSLLVALYSPKLADINELETALNTLRQQPLAAQIWHTQLQLGRWINELNNTLEQAFKRFPCDSSVHVTQIENLKLIYQRDFQGKIHPITKGLTDAANSLAPYFQQLEENQVLAKPFKGFLGQRKLDFDLYLDALQRHDNLWQNLFRQCQTANQKV